MSDKQRDPFQRSSKSHSTKAERGEGGTSMFSLGCAVSYRRLNLVMIDLAHTYRQMVHTTWRLDPKSLPPGSPYKEARHRR